MKLDTLRAIRESVNARTLSKVITELFSFLIFVIIGLSGAVLRYHILE